MKKLRIIAGFLLFFLSISVHKVNAGSLSLCNYDNHPALAKALEYDFEGGADYEKADHLLAEKYYLEYLEDVNESFQRARVYDHLGAIFATAINPKKGEKPDLDKARYYFKKVLENEPERIDYATIRARTMLASLKSTTTLKSTTKERVKARIEVYKWLLSLDGNKIRKLWLPLRPDNKEPTKLQMDGTKSLVKALKICESTNIISGTKHLDRSDKEAFLSEVVRRFPNTNLGEMAVELAQKENIDLPEDSFEQMSELKEPKEIPLAASKQSVMQEMDRTVTIWKKASFYIIAFVATIIIFLVFWAVRGKATEK